MGEETTQSLRMKEFIAVHILSFLGETDILSTHHHNKQWLGPGGIPEPSMGKEREKGGGGGRGRGRERERNC